MKTTKSDLFCTIIALYFILGGGMLMFWLVYKMGVVAILLSLLPSVFTLAVMSFWLVCGAYYLIRRNNKGKNLLDACLLIQCIQVGIWGLSFQNYFGPYLGVGLRDDMTTDFVFKIRLFDFYFMNGYKKYSDEIYLIFNLVPLALLFFGNWLKKKDQPDRHRFDGFLDKMGQ